MFRTGGRRRQIDQVAGMKQRRQMDQAAGVFRRALVAVGVVAVALSVTACGEKDSDSPGGTVTASADPALAAKVPDAVKADGKIIIGTDSTYAPAEFEENAAIVGFDVDLFNAVAAKLGLTTEWVKSGFGDIIPGVTQSGKYEAGVSSFTIDNDRKAQALMISYFKAGTQWATKAGNPSNVKIDDACGKKVAVQKDTVQAKDVTLRSQACLAGAKPEITVDAYPGQDAVTQAVLTGKSDAMLADSPVGAYAVKQTDGQLELLGEVYDSAPYGYVVKKDQQAFAEALRDAVLALIADGTYRQILDKWGVAGGAITDPAINP